MPGPLASTTFAIEVDGQALARGLAASVIAVIVDDSLHLPDTFAIWIQETAAMDVATQAGIDIGSKIKISTQGVNDQSPVVLIEGEATALEGEYREGKPSMLLIRGYDQAHRLMRGRKNKVWADQKYSDIARTIASDAGLTVGSVDDTGTAFKFVHQHNQTDWEFLKALAKLVGYEVSVPEGQFVFRAPVAASTAPQAGDHASTNPLQLVLGQDLLEFRPRVTAGGQAKNVVVRGWDVAGKQALLGDKPVQTTSVSLTGGDTPASLAQKFGDPEFVSGDRPMGTQDDVDMAAEALAEQVGSAFAEATGRARGNPHLRAGEAVSIALVGPRFAGNYTLTHTRHTFDLRDGYQTHFEVSGRNERSLLGLTAGSGGSATPGTTSGVQVGIVTDIDDPDAIGRVRVKLPYAGDDFVTDWARVVMPGAGPDRGQVWLPEVNDEVLVAFLHGSVRAPFVLGGLWNGQDAPPNLKIANGELEERTFVSRTGQKIVFQDKSGATGIKISSADDSLFVHIDVDNKKILITADSGGEVKVTTAGNFSIESQGSVKISGQGGVEISSPAQTKVSGNGSLSLESGGMTAVKGAQVSLG